MMTPIEKKIFENFENKVDLLIESLRIKSEPVRVPYTHLFCLLESSHASVNIDNGTAHSNLGPSLVSRYSYLLSTFTQSPLLPAGESAFDAVQALEDDLREEMTLLISYAHFCEIAPFAWRGSYNVVEEIDGISLTHRSDEIQRYEARDIVLSRLTLPITIDAPITYQPYYDMWVAKCQEPNISEFEEIIISLSGWFRKYALEVSPLSDAAMRSALGVSFDQFCRFRSVWHAFASFHIGMSDAFRRLLAKCPEKAESVGELYLDWIAPMIKQQYMENLVRKISRLSSVQYNSLMAVYSFDPKAPANGGEGFFPPICRLNDGLLISPWALRGMMSSRNILYALLQTDQRKFDEEVSPLLEPQLTEIASRMFNDLAHVEVVPNFSWSKGEFDLLVYRKSENCVLHVQIKAALAPEGARMTARVESRIREGLDQLAKFKKLNQTVQDAILSKALQQDIKDAQVIDVILCWTGFGTSKIWALLGNVAPLNIALLAHLVREDTGRSLRNFAQDTHALIEKIVEEASPSWYMTKVVLGEQHIVFPNMDCNWDSLVKYQTAVHKLLWGK